MSAEGSLAGYSTSRIVSLVDTDSVKFWYSRRSVVAFLVGLFLIVHALSYLVPPFQSPDEFYHLKRAYLLSEGTVVLDKQNGVSGGYIDTGLLEYMSNFRQDRWFPYDPSGPTSTTKPTLARGIHWTGGAVFSDIPNVAVYFPLPYVPQAVAFKVGKSTGMTVASSYYLARSLSLVASLIILCAACFLYPVPPMVAALFLMPMTLFQLGSPTLDAVSFSTVVLTGALYMRSATKEFTFTTGMLILLTVCLFSLATTRVNLIVLTLLPCVLYFVRRSYRYLISGAAALLLSLSWVVFSLINVTGGHGNSPELRSQIVTHYLHHLGSFFVIVYDTVTNESLVLADVRGCLRLVRNKDSRWRSRPGMGNIPSSFHLYGICLSTGFPRGRLFSMEPFGCLEQACPLFGHCCPPIGIPDPAYIVGNLDTAASQIHLRNSGTIFHTHRNSGELRASGIAPIYRRDGDYQQPSLSRREHFRHGNVAGASCNLVGVLMQKFLESVTLA
jgi:hypothetical protein